MRAPSWPERIWAAWVWPQGGRGCPGHCGTPQPPQGLDLRFPPLESVTSPSGPSSRASSRGLPCPRQTPDTCPWLDLPPAPAGTSGASAPRRMAPGRGSRHWAVPSPGLALGPEKRERHPDMSPPSTQGYGCQGERESEARAPGLQKPPQQRPALHPKTSLARGGPRGDQWSHSLFLLAPPSCPHCLQALSLGLCAPGPQPQPQLGGQRDAPASSVLGRSRNIALPCLAPPCWVRGSQGGPGHSLGLLGWKEPGLLPPPTLAMHPEGARGLLGGIRAVGRLSATSVSPSGFQGKECGQERGNDQRLEGSGSRRRPQPWVVHE